METSPVIVKSAGPKLDALKPWLSLGAKGGAGVAQQVGWDQYFHPDSSVKESLGTLVGQGGDKQRTIMSLLNIAMGTGGAHYLAKSSPRSGKVINTGAGEKSVGKITTGGAGLNFTKGLGLALGIPTKDAILAGGKLAVDSSKALPDLVTAANKETKVPEGLTTKDKLVMAALGVGAIGAGAYGAHRIGKSMDAQSNASNSGRVTLTLPTKNPNDVETQVSIPLSDAGVSAKTYSQLGRDVRRRLRGESKERKMAYIEAIEKGMDPDTANLLMSKASAGQDAPISILAGSHIKSIAAEHAPVDPDADKPVEEKKEVQKPDVLLKHKVGEQEKRIKQLEKFLGQANGSKLTQVRDNLKNIKLKKTAYVPTLNEVQAMPQANNAPGGFQGARHTAPILFGPKFQAFKRMAQPFLTNSSNPLISKLFGETRPSPDAIVRNEIL